MTISRRCGIYKLEDIHTDNNGPAESHAANVEPFIQIMGPLVDALEDSGVTLGETWRNITL